MQNATVKQAARLVQAIRQTARLPGRAGHLNADFSLRVVAFAGAEAGTSGLNALSGQMSRGLVGVLYREDTRLDLLGRKVSARLTGRKPCERQGQGQKIQKLSVPSLLIRRIRHEK
ncbi:MAG: hypothetical protein R3C19_06535 [Planctomycetaceae bacterium]